MARVKESPPVSHGQRTRLLTHTPSARSAAAPAGRPGTRAPIPCMCVSPRMRVHTPTHCSSLVLRLHEDRPPHAQSSLQTHRCPAGSRAADYSPPWTEPSPLPRRSSPSRPGPRGCTHPVLLSTQRRCRRQPGLLPESHPPIPSTSRPKATPRTPPLARRPGHGTGKSGPWALAAGCSRWASACATVPGELQGGSCPGRQAPASIGSQEERQLGPGTAGSACSARLALN